MTYLIHKLMEPYLWYNKPSISYINTVKTIFGLLNSLIDTENILYLFKLFQFNFLPLFMMRVPILGSINYDPKMYPYEKIVIINNIPVFKIGKSDNKILYVHGGGFISGDYMAFRSFCLEIYRRCDSNVEIWFPVYSLYPENSIYNIIREIDYIHSLNNFCSIIADSAGCYLALNIINANKLILISPVYDLSCSSDRYRENNDINFNTVLVKKIFKTIDHKIPINDNVSNVRIHIFVSKNELFIDDSVSISKLYRDTNINIYESSIHSLPIYYKYNEMSCKCLDDIVNILKFDICT